MNGLIKRSWNVRTYVHATMTSWMIESYSMWYLSKSQDKLKQRRQAQKIIHSNGVVTYKCSLRKHKIPVCVHSLQNAYEVTT